MLPRFWQGSPILNSVGVTAQEDRVSFRRKCFYSLGAVPDPITIGTVGNFLMLFYNGVLGVPGTWVGIVLIVPRIWDAITDPWFGKISDNCGSPMGHRRPFILFGGLGMAVAYALLWSPPAFLTSNATNLAYLMIVGVLYFTAYTFYFIPYSALGLDLTPDYDERTAIMAVRNLFGSLGQMVIYTMPMVAAWWSAQLGQPGNDRLGYRMTGIVVAAICAALCAASFFGTRERPASEMPAQMSFRASALTTLRNTVFLRLAAAVFSLALAVMTLASYVSYLFLYYLDGCSVTILGWTLDNRELLALNGVYAGILGMGCTFPWWGIARRIGKTRALFLAVALVAVACLSTWFAFNRTYPGLVFLYGAFSALGWAGAMILAPAIMADIVDMDELATGQRREGSYTGVFGFIFKMGVAGALPLLGWGVDLVGFDPVLGSHQAPETYLKLRLVATFLSAAFASISAVTLLGLPLSPQRAHDTRRALEKRRGKASAT